MFMVVSENRDGVRLVQACIIYQIRMRRWQCDLHISIDQLRLNTLKNLILNNFIALPYKTNLCTLLDRCFFSFGFL
jgi:hypothetical protein